MEIQFNMQALEKVPYKLVNFVDKTCDPYPDSMIFEETKDLKLELMVFETGDVVGIEREIILDPKSLSFIRTGSLVIGKTHQTIIGTIVGPTVKTQLPINLSYYPFADIKMVYYVKNKIVEGPWFHNVWNERNTPHKIESILGQIQLTQPDNAFFRKIQESPLFISDTKDNELFEEISEKAKVLNKLLERFKKQ